MKIALFQKQYNYRTEESNWMVKEVYNLNDGDIYGKNELIDGSARLSKKDISYLEKTHSYYKFKIIDENDYTLGTFPINFEKVNSKFSEYEDFAGV